MKLFLDDVRDAPDNTWMVFRDAPSFIHLARHVKSDGILSFDHDLGEESKLTGYDAIVQLEMEVITQGLWSVHGMPTILIHSANPVGRERMLASINSIRRHFGHTKLRMDEVYKEYVPQADLDDEIVLQTIRAQGQLDLIKDHLNLIIKVLNSSGAMKDCYPGIY